MAFDQRPPDSDVDPLTWAVVAGLTLAVVTALGLLVSGRFTGQGLLLVLLVPGIVGSAAWLGWALRQ
jgi:hypothetical protein